MPSLKLPKITLLQVITASDWLWILHDDCLRADTCLEEQLVASEAGAPIAAVTPKVFRADGTLPKSESTPQPQEGAFRLFWMEKSTRDSMTVSPTFLPVVVQVFWWLPPLSIRSVV